MLFGMKSSEAMLVWGMKKLLQGLDHIESYVDDLIHLQKDLSTHLQVLNKLL